MTPREQIWAVTDGRAGIEAQALGLAEAVARRRPSDIVCKRIKMRAPFRALPRQLWRDPFAALDSAADALGPPWPDLWVGCGRLSVPFSMAVKRRSAGTFVVQVQNPRAPLGGFDLVVPPSHDRIEGANVFPILGSPNRLDAPALRSQVASGAAPVAVLIGGPNRAFRLDVADAERIAAALAGLEMPLDITLSRRTPSAAAAILRRKTAGYAARFFDPSKDSAGANPYPAMLGTARAVLVTEDSVNMAAEAASTGKPVYILPLARRPFASPRKFDAFHEDLRARGASRLFHGEIAAWTYEPLDETARAADEIIRRWRR